MPVNWSLYEKEATKLYMEDGKSAEETIKLLNEQRGASISIRQFKAKFSGRKKLRADEWQVVASEIRKREAQGIASDVYLYGRRQDPERVKRALRLYGRNGKGLPANGIDLPIRTSDRNRVEIRTPAPHEVIPLPGEASRAVPAATSNTNAQASLLVKSPGGLAHEGSGHDVAIDMEAIELDFSTPPPVDLINPTSSSFSNAIGINETNRFRTVSLATFQEGVLAVQRVSKGMPQNTQQVALQQGRGSSGFTTYNQFAVSPPSSGTIHHPGELSGSLRIFPGLDILIPEISEGNPLGTAHKITASGYSQVYASIPRGQAGWLQSHLIERGSNLKHLQPIALLVEDILTDIARYQDLRFDGHNQETFNEMLFVVTHLVLNKFMNRAQLFKFIQWVLNIGRVGMLYEHLQKESSDMSAFITEALHAISDEAYFKKFGRPPSWMRKQPLDRENYFVLKHPAEIIKLIQAADNRALSSHLGGRLLIHVAQSNNLEAAKLLISYGVNPNYEDSMKFSFEKDWSLDINAITPLCSAVRSGSIEMLNYLVDVGADVNERFYRKERFDRNQIFTCLSEAVGKKNYNMVKALLDKGAKVFPDLAINGISIHKHAKRTLPTICKLLAESLESTFDPGATTTNSFLIMEAAEDGNDSLSNFLCKHGIVGQETLEAALCAAIEHWNTKAVRTFLHRGVDPNALAHRRALYLDGYDEDSNELGEDWDEHEDSTRDRSDTDSCHTEDPDNIDKFMDSHPIKVVVSRAFNNSTTVEIIYLLIKAGASLTDEALLHMGYRRAADILATMFQLGANVSVTGPSALELYAMEGRLDRCGLLLDAGVDINAYGANGRSALQAAARGDYEGPSLALVEHLLDRGADVNLPASDESMVRVPTGGYRLTALQAAALGGNSQVVDRLIEAGAEVTAPPARTDGLTVLEAAAAAFNQVQHPPGSSMEKRIATFKKLLAHGAPINRLDGTGCTMLHRLVNTSQIECLDLALRASAATEDRWPSDSPHLFAGMTPIQIAAELHKKEAILLLLKYDADINASASNERRGVTALQAAITDRDWPRGGDETEETEEIVRLLLHHKAEVNAAAGNQAGRTALQAATSAEQPNAKVVALLLERNADVNMAPALVRGVTALQGAAISGDIQIARMLLAYKADVNAQAAPEEGRTAIEGAAEHGRLDMVRLLLDEGAIPDANAGFSRAIQFAEDDERFDIANLLREREQAYNSSSMGLVDQMFLNFESLPLDTDMVEDGNDEHEVQL
ncbi:ankyrin repeat-containing domain protein [Ilyonectria sp. MPI-CAGE-AT-0026]|nr:ankyrin repeat-containing domain protein [Ilyonectria sp. MPI-CAGE-AT-0026]